MEPPLQLFAWSWDRFPTGGVKSSREQAKKPRKLPPARTAGEPPCTSLRSQFWPGTPPPRPPPRHPITTRSWVSSGRPGKCIFCSPSGENPPNPRLCRLLLKVGLHQQPARCRHSCSSQPEPTAPFFAPRALLAPREREPREHEQGRAVPGSPGVWQPPARSASPAPDPREAVRRRRGRSAESCEVMGKWLRGQAAPGTGGSGDRRLRGQAAPGTGSASPGWPWQDLPSRGAQEDSGAPGRLIPALPITAALSEHEPRNLARFHQRRCWWGPAAAARPRHQKRGALSHSPARGRAAGPDGASPHGDLLLRALAEG
nr:translation initiation factor IF-2-like [Anser cygnoides]